MDTKTISNQALAVIDRYLHFKIGAAECSVPYFNNKTTRARAAIRSAIGKGSPEEIQEEIQAIMAKDHADAAALTGESLKKTLTDHNIGIDCSAFAYYVLDAESRERKKGPLHKNIDFINCRGFTGKLRSLLRPIENCDVATFAHDTNSLVVDIRDVAPGDIVTMLGGPKESAQNHILVIHRVDRQNSLPTKIHYSHSMLYLGEAYYSSGVRQGAIDVVDPSKPLVDQRWSEGGAPGSSEKIVERMKDSKVELRRLKALSISK